MSLRMSRSDDMASGIPAVDSAVHLAVESGCGGTTFALQQARMVLEGDGRVVWVCFQQPDPDRFSQLFGVLPPATLARFHRLVAGELMSQGIDSARELADSMSSIQLIVVDDWTPETGHVSAMTLASVAALAGSDFADRGGILLVSAAYSDASGKQVDGGLKARGENRLSEFGFSTWWLQTDESGVGRRRVRVGEEEIALRLETEGFEKS